LPSIVSVPVETFDDVLDRHVVRRVGYGLVQFVQQALTPYAYGFCLQNGVPVHGPQPLTQAL
jgi:hypothetical protein